MSEPIDIGHGHSLEYFSWHPDDLPANRERYGVPLPNVPRVGCTIYHTNPSTGEECSGAIHFDLPEMAKFWPEAHRWQVQSMDPLTVSPSVLCRQCGDHGFILDGKWVPA